MLNVNSLLRFFGKPVPDMVIVVPPSGDPELGNIDNIFNSTFSPAKL